MQWVVAVLSRSSCSVLVSRSSMMEPEAARDTQVVDIDIFLCSVFFFFCSTTKFLCCCFEIVSSVVFGVFTCAHVQYTIEATCPMTSLTQPTTARLNSGFLHQQNNNGTCYYRGWESHRPPPSLGVIKYVV
jgi:hypothetical protein